MPEMKIKLDEGVARLYEDFEPSFDWQREEECEKLVFQLHGITISCILLIITITKPKISINWDWLYRTYVSVWSGLK